MNNKSRRSVSFSPWPIVLFLCCVVLGAGVFVVTQSVQDYEARIAKINQTLLSEQQTQRVLDAEWAYLTRPQRLEDLLGMKTKEDLVAQAAAVEAEKQKEAEAVAEVKVEDPAVKKVAVKSAPKKVEKKAVVKKTAVKKAKTPEIDVWPIAKKNTAVPEKIQPQPLRHVGVARPILE